MDREDEQYYRDLMERKRREHQEAEELGRVVPPELDPIAPVTPEQLAQLARSPGGSSGFTRLSSVLNTGSELLGSPGETTCLHCGARLIKQPQRVNAHLQVLAWPDHSCPGLLGEREAARLAAQERELARQRQLMLERANPSRERVASLRGLANLPRWSPAGLEALLPEECPPPFLDAIQHHRDQWLAGQQPDQGLWLVGRTSSRKTCLLTALAFEVANWTSHLPLYWDFTDLVEQVRRQAQELPSGWDPIRAETAPMLVLDDLGQVKLTEKVRETLYLLINQAVNRCGERGVAQTLYIATNQTPDQLMDRLATPERPDGGEPVIRRLVQHCEVVEWRRG